MTRGAACRLLAEIETMLKAILAQYDDMNGEEEAALLAARSRVQNAIIATS